MAVLPPHPQMAVLMLSKRSKKLAKEHKAIYKLRLKIFVQILCPQYLIPISETLKVHAQFKPSCVRTPAKLIRVWRGLFWRNLAEER